MYGDLQADNPLASMDEDEDLALPNDAEDMHKMLHMRREELKQIKEHKTQVNQNARLGNSDGSSRNMVDALKSSSSVCDFLSGQPALESINNIASSY